VCIFIIITITIIMYAKWVGQIRGKLHNISLSCRR